MTEEYIINPWLFYFIDISENVKCFGFIVGFISTVTSLISFVVMKHDENTYNKEYCERVYKNIKRIFTIGVIGFVLAIFIPSREACYRILVAKYITPSTVESSINFIVDTAEKISKRLN